MLFSLLKTFFSAHSSLEKRFLKLRKSLIFDKNNIGYCLVASSTLKTFLFRENKLIFRCKIIYIFNFCKVMKVNFAKPKKISSTNFVENLKDPTPRHNGHSFQGAREIISIKNRNKLKIKMNK